MKQIFHRMLILTQKKVRHLAGYIKLHRQITEWEWYTDLNAFKVFIHLLLIANIKDTKYMGQIVKRGSKVIKESALGDEVGLTHQEVRTAIGKLTRSGEIIKKSTNKFTVITVVKYEDYQGFTEGEQQTNNNQTTNNQQTNNKPSTNIEEELKELREFKELNNTPISPAGESGGANNGESLAIETVADKPNETGSHSQTRRTHSQESEFESNGENLAVETAVDKPSEGSHSTTRKAQNRKPSGVLSKEQQQRFDLFWAAYPNRKSTGQAERTFAKLEPDDALLQEILRGIERAKRLDSRFREARYIPHASTWLNAKGWLDKFADAPSQNKPVISQNRFANCESHDWDFGELAKQEEQYIKDRLAAKKAVHAEA